MSGLTVAVTYFNEKELLTRCLKSLLEGARVPEEILVFDDASQFPARDYIPDHPAIRVHRNPENVGPSRGRNTLLAQSTQEWIHFHDADDWFHPQWFERVSAHWTEAQAVFTEVQSYREGELYRDRVIGWEALEGEELLPFALSHFILVPSATYQTEFLRKVGGFPIVHQSEDFALSLEVALRSPRFRVVPEPLVCIDLRAEGRSRANPSEPWRDTLEVLESVGPNLESRYHHDLATAFGRVGGKLFELAHPDLAQKAFALADRYGTPSFSHRSSFYRALARWVGPMVAERVGALVRRSRSR